jgi:riboflavin biosynthesis pyrimidine reductase
MPQSAGGGWHRAEREPATEERSVLDPVVALEMLRERYGVGLLLVEGGPTFNHALISTNLVDELFLTLSPRLLGGEKSPTILEGPNLPPPVGQALNLTSLYLADDVVLTANIAAMSAATKSAKRMHLSALPATISCC